MTYKDALADFLSREEITESALAAKVGKSQVAIHRYKRGDRFPDAATARQIEQVSAGAVPFAVWQQEFLARSGLAA